MERSSRFRTIRGEPPTAFLKKIGIGFGMPDVTNEASGEAELAIRTRLEPAAVSEPA